MKAYQKQFLDTALELGALKFGEFTLKSGRISPYFFNAGLFSSGLSMRSLGSCYAQAILAEMPEFDLLFGPAYKGIPLVTAASVIMADRVDRDIPFALNRKERKQHGEGGRFVGAPLTGRVVILDDVITAGTAIREVMQLLSTVPEVEVVGCMLALDRQERGQDERSAVQEVEQSFAIPVKSVVNLDTLIDYADEKAGLADVSDAIRAYRSRYGVRELK